jgi:tetratricopeptide (TPR) repeat protein
VKRLFRLFAALFVIFAVSGCSFGWDWVLSTRVHRAVARHQFDTAVELLQKLIDRHPDSPRALAAARNGARIAHFEAKEYARAVDFYKLVILRSPDPEERKSAQRYIAQICFENLRDYDQAVAEYERLLKLDCTPEEAFHYRLNLAKSHFQLNDLDQAATEIDILLERKPTPDQVKRLTDAAALWEEILHDFPERSRKENVGLNLVVCYEELKDFGKAIDVLERMKPDYPNPDFINRRIERLAQRKANQPGARGLRR